MKSRKQAREVAMIGQHRETRDMGQLLRAREYFFAHLAGLLFSSDRKQA